MICFLDDPYTAGCCTVLSVFGVVILTGKSSTALSPPVLGSSHPVSSPLISRKLPKLPRQFLNYLLTLLEPRSGQFGLAFSGRTEAMTGSTNDPDDPTAVAHVCYMAAAVYAAFLVFCGCQVCSSTLSASHSHLLSIYGGARRHPEPGLTRFLSVRR